MFLFNNLASTHLLYLIQGIAAGNIQFITFPGFLHYPTALSDFPFLQKLLFLFLLITSSLTCHPKSECLLGHFTILFTTSTLKNSE